MSWKKIAAYTDKDILDVLLYPYTYKIALEKYSIDHAKNNFQEGDSVKWNLKRLQ